ncbi:MAG: leucine-rich repeat protein, partial [Ruminococcus sp.]|nr:leucine-rich repeat protein [Ruminococcus sp.]
IESMAFFDCINLKSVTFGKGITNITSQAFENCTGLKSVKIPENVTSIDLHAFYFCTSLESVTIPSKASIGAYAFAYCESLKSVTIRDGVEVICNDAFTNCTSLKSIVIPASVTYIGVEALGYYNGKPINDFTIFSFADSEAERYAANKKFTFVTIEELPTLPDEPEPTPDATTTITLKKSSAAVYVKGTTQISATVKNGNGKTTYKSSNSKIAKVSSSGKITGVKKGTATITVTNNGVSKSFKVTVKNPKLNKTKKTLKKGKSFTIKITGKVGKAKFTSSNKKVAKVNSKGKVTAKKKGKANITVKANGLKLKCKITVK